MFQVKRSNRFQIYCDASASPELDIQKALGAAIRELRTKKGASLEALAADAGISKNMLSLIERGEGNPSWSTVEGIATALGVSVSQLAKRAE